MKKKEEKIKLSLGIFCSVCILTMVFLLTEANPEDLLTSLDKVEKNIHVEFTKDKESDEVIIETYDVINFENINVYDTTVEDYEVTFDNKSGKVSYILYIENKSSNDAVLDKYVLPNPVCKGFQEDCEKVLLGLDYSIKDEYGINLQAGDIIKAKERKMITITIEYNAEQNNLPSASTDISNLGFSLNFTAK